MRRKSNNVYAFGPIAIAMAVGFFAWTNLGSESLLSIVQSDNCVIKGNISYSGENIYHVPGRQYYDATRISPSKGERWFCSEEEARAAGWRRSRR